MKKYILIGFIAILGILSLFIYKRLTYTYITVQFKELRPMEKSIPVYYKGLIIGKAKESKHSDDYNHTLVKVVLYPKNLHLPSNTEVYLKQIIKNKHTSDFLELIYPETPNNKLISDGTYLKGYTTGDVESYMKNLKTEELENIKTNLASATENLNNALGGLSELFVILQDVINENRANLKTTTKNINNTSANLNQATQKINNSIKEEQLTKSLNNIENTILNIEQTTQSVNQTAESFNNSVPSINKSINSTQQILANANAITCGIRETLNKPFGGLRLIFGKTIQEPKCNSKCR